MMWFNLIHVSKNQNNYNKNMKNIMNKHKNNPKVKIMLMVVMIWNFEWQIKSESIVSHHLPITNSQKIINKTKINS